MKKHLLFLVLALAVALAFSGCQPKPAEAVEETTAAETEAVTEAPATEGALVDGSYYATYSHTDTRGWRAFVELTVEGGKITVAKGDYINADGKLKTEDTAYAERMKGVTNVAPAEAFEQLQAQVLEKQSAEIDAVAGATHSSESYIHMVEGLIEKAKAGDTSELVLEANGDYTAKGEADERGWTPAITVTFEGGKISAVVFDETNAEDKAKSTDEDYAKMMSDKTKVTPKEAYDQLAAALVEKQDPAAVDAVAGATASSDKFKELAQKAISTRAPYAK